MSEDGMVTITFKSEVLPDLRWVHKGINPLTNTAILLLQQARRVTRYVAGKPANHHIEWFDVPTVGPND